MTAFSYSGYRFPKLAPAHEGSHGSHRHAAIRSRTDAPWRRRAPIAGDQHGPAPPPASDTLVIIDTPGIDSHGTRGAMQAAEAAERGRRESHNAHFLCGAA